MPIIPKGSLLKKWKKTKVQWVDPGSKRPTRRWWKWQGEYCSTTATVQHILPCLTQLATFRPETALSSSISAFQSCLRRSGTPPLAYCSFPTPRQIVLDAATQSATAMYNRWSQHVTLGHIAAAHGRFNRIRPVAPMCTTPG